jgi:predicted RNase H-like HicB family nuclease
MKQAGRIEMKQEYLVVYEFAKGSYSGYAPDLPGCISIGSNHEEMRKNMREAVEAHISSLVENGKEIPSQVTTTIHFKKPVEETDVQHWIIERMEIEVPVSRNAEQKMASV